MDKAMDRRLVSEGMRGVPVWAGLSPAGGTGYFRDARRLASQPLSDVRPSSGVNSAGGSVGTRHKMSISSIDRSRKTSSIGLGANTPPAFGPI